MLEFRLQPHNLQYPPCYFWGYIDLLRKLGCLVGCNKYCLIPPLPISRCLSYMIGHSLIFLIFCSISPFSLDKKTRWWIKEELNSLTLFWKKRQLYLILMGCILHQNYIFGHCRDPFWSRYFSNLCRYPKWNFSQMVRSNLVLIYTSDELIFPHYSLELVQNRDGHKLNYDPEIWTNQARSLVQEPRFGRSPG